MDKNLARYLNDHLAGSSAALLLIQELADNHDAPEAQQFFLHLKKAVKADQLLLEDLLKRIAQHPSTFLKITGRIAAQLTGIKLIWEQIKPGNLGLYEALEMLALGVEGKRLLWGALQEVSASFPEWDGIDFGELDLRAMQQRDDIEFWRMRAARDILADKERRMRTKVS